MQLCVLMAVVVSLALAGPEHGYPVTHVGPKLLSIVLVQAIVVVAAWGITGYISGQANSLDAPISRTRRRLERWTIIHTTLWLAATLLALTVLDWPRLVGLWIPARIFPPLRPLLFLLPALVPLLLSWYCFYDADRALGCAGSDRSRWTYVGGQIRRLILPSVLPAVLLMAGLETIKAWMPEIPDRIGLAAQLGLVSTVVLAIPNLLQRFWKTEPLAAGPLRQRLLSHSRRHQIRLNEILVWPTEGQVVGAALSGWSPASRHVLLTDGLLANLSEDQVEMVYLHEVGHAKHNHNAWLAAVFAVSLGLGAIAVGIQPGITPMQSLQLAIVILTSLIAVGQVAWAFEFESDAWAHARSGREIDDYLATLSKLHSGSAKRSTWLHPSLYLRARFLRHSPRRQRGEIHRRYWTTVVLVLGVAAIQLAMSLGI